MSVRGLELKSNSVIDNVVGERDSDDIIANIELTNRCNLKCKMCFLPEMKRPKQDMDFELYKRIIDSTRNLRYVSLSNWGEPLLYPNLIEAIQYAVDKGIKVNVTTNGTLLGDAFIVNFLRSKLSSLQVSIDGIGEDYERIRGVDFDEMKTRINRLFRIVKNKIFLVIRTTVMKDDDNIDLIGQIKSNFPFADLYVFQPVVTFRWKPIKSMCKHLSDRHLVVLSNGTVLPCCVDYEGDFLSLGNVNDEPDLSKYIDRQIKLGLPFLPEICFKCTELDCFAQKRYG